MGRVGAVAAGLLRSCHPEPTAAVTLMITALAATAGHRAGGVVLIGRAVLTGQLSIGWLNDLLDAERDRAVGRPDKPIAAGTVSARAVRTATGRGRGSPAFRCRSPAVSRPGAAHLAAVAAGWAYDLGLKSSRLSVLPYLVCFGLLPVFVVLALPGSPLPPWWLPTAGALLGAGAHFANVLPDLDDDAATGVRGLPHRIGGTASHYAAAVLLLAATVLLADRCARFRAARGGGAGGRRAGPRGRIPAGPAARFAGPVPRGAGGGRTRRRLLLTAGTALVPLTRARRPRQVGGPAAGTTAAQRQPVVVCFSSSLLSQLVVVSARRCVSSVKATRSKTRMRPGRMAAQVSGRPVSM